MLYTVTEQLITYKDKKVKQWHTSFSIETLVKKCRIIVLTSLKKKSGD